MDSIALFRQHISADNFSGSSSLFIERQQLIRGQPNNKINFSRDSNSYPDSFFSGTDKTTKTKYISLDNFFIGDSSAFLRWTVTDDKTTRTANTGFAKWRLTFNLKVPALYYLCFVGQLLAFNPPLLQSPKPLAVISKTKQKTASGQQLSHRQLRKFSLTNNLGQHCTRLTITFVQTEIKKIHLQNQDKPK